jgi:murein DD-endopeptidase MepM/ murein hydrolase activator NlpD
VYYVHAENVTLKLNDRVVAGQIVGTSGAGSDGYAHLHLEIRSTTNDMVYNPIYFFDPDVWNSINLNYQAYNSSGANPETRVYAIRMSTGFDYWNWNGSYPFVYGR